MSDKEKSRVERIIGYINRRVNPLARMEYLREKENERIIEEINDD